MAGRSFNPEAVTEESTALIALLKSLNVDQWTCHIDLHETTDTDETEFRPAKAARDGQDSKPGEIPDGFYLVADSTNPKPQWHARMIDAVRQVTHIALADEEVCARPMSKCPLKFTADLHLASHVYLS